MTGWLIVSLLVAGCKQPTPDSGTPAVDGPDPCLTGEPLPFDEMAGPSAPVEVLIDEQGTPHVYAATDLDAIWAAGYVQAAQRLPQLDMSRRSAMGTRAQVLGESGLASDYQARELGFPLWGCRATVAMREARPDDFLKNDAWTSGVNARIAEVEDGTVELPDDFGPDALDYLPEPLRPEEVMAMGKRLQFGFAITLPNEVLYSVMLMLISGTEDIPTFEPGVARWIVEDAAPARHPAGLPWAAGAPAEVTPAELARLSAALSSLEANHGWGGSNNWVVSGDHTTDGHPLLANDPHAIYEYPGGVQVQHINSADAGGTIDVAGFGFVGVPGVQLGHNRTVAWAATTNQADAMDIWAIDATDTTASVGGEELPLVIDEQTIPVRQEDGSIQGEAFTVRRVEGYGVLLSDKVLPLPPSLLAGEGAVLFNWTGYTAGEDLFEYLDFMQATDLDSFADAVSLEQAGMMNWLSATADDMRYQAHGRVPLRGDAQANAMMDGDDPTTLWINGDLGAEHMPSLDGSQDFIVTANNDPWGHTADGDPTNDEFYYGSYYAPGFRADRITRLLEASLAEGAVDAADLEGIQMDATSPLALRMQPLLQDAVDACATDASLAEWCEDTAVMAAASTLLSWDGDMTVDTHEPLLFRAWMAFVEDEVLADDAGLVFTMLEGYAALITAKITLVALEAARDGGHGAAIIEGDGHAAILTALSRAVTELDAKGWQDTTWGQVHVASFAPPSGDPVTVPAQGDETTIDVAGCSFLDGDGLKDSCQVTLGAIFRQVTSFDDDGRPRMRFNCSYCNDLDIGRWQRGEYVELPFDRDEVEAHRVETWLLPAAE